MAEYNVDDIFRDDSGAPVFNEQDVSSGVDAVNEIKELIDNELDGFVKTTGDVMTGSLIVPSIELTNAGTQLKFADLTTQNTALTNELVSSMNNVITNTEYITKSGLNETSVNSNFKLGTTGNKIIFPNSLGSQNYPYTDAERNTNISTGQKTTNMSYDSGLLLTSVSNNLYAQNLTCGNINTSHLSGTTSNLQTQINNISQIATNASPTFSSIKINDGNVIDTTIETFNQNDYNTFYKFYNTIEIQPATYYRKYYIGSAGDNATTSNQFCIATDYGGDPNPKIIFSLSKDSAYFFGIKQPLVPVGSVQIYAGFSSNIPAGYLLCNGASVSQTTYNLLYAVIGNAYQYNKTLSTGMFYLPDLRGMFIRGAGVNTTYGSFSAGSSESGSFQKDSVQRHSHKYDKANNTINVQSNTGVSSSVWDNSSDVMNTGSTIYDIDATTIFDNETRPNNISMHYIIKF